MLKSTLNRKTYANATSYNSKQVTYWLRLCEEYANNLQNYDNSTLSRQIRSLTWKSTRGGSEEIYGDDVVFFRATNKYSFFKKFSLSFNNTLSGYQVLLVFLKSLYWLILIACLGFVFFLGGFTIYFILLGGDILELVGQCFLEKTWVMQLSKKLYLSGTDVEDNLKYFTQLNTAFVGCAAYFKASLSVIFSEWEAYMGAQEFHWNFESLRISSHVGFLILFFCYCVLLVFITKFFWFGFYMRSDPWNFLLNYFFSNKFLSIFFNISSLEQILQTKTNSFLTLNTDSNLELTKQFMFDYNTGVGWGGYVGFIDYFPAHGSFFSLMSFKKRRMRPYENIIFLRDFWQVSSRKLKSIRRKFLPTSWISFTLRDLNIFNKHLNQPQSVKPNLYTRARIFTQLYSNLIYYTVLQIFSTISNLGDSEVVKLREKVFFYLNNGREPWIDAYYANSVAPNIPASQTIGDSTGWYRREVTTVVLAQTLKKKIRVGNSSMFKLGWQNLVNDYSFWLNTKSPDQLTAHNFYYDEEEWEYDDYEYFDTAGYSVSEKRNYDSWGLGELEPETGEEMEDKEEVFFFEDGFLHDDVESVAFDEEDLFDAIDEGVNKANYFDEEDFEIKEFLGNQLIAYGAGQETDYLGNGSMAKQHEDLVTEFEPQSYAKTHTWSSFYDDICDLHWLNSCNSSYKNFFEFPCSRFLDPSTSNKLIKKSVFLRRFSEAGKLLTYVSNYLPDSIFFKFDRIYRDQFISILAGFFYLFFLFLLIVSTYDFIEILPILWFISFCLLGYVTLVGLIFCIVVFSGSGQIYRFFTAKFTRGLTHRFYIFLMLPLLYFFCFFDSFFERNFTTSVTNKLHALVDRPKLCWVDLYPSRTIISRNAWNYTSTLTWRASLLSKNKFNLNWLNLVEKQIKLRQFNRAATGSTIFFSRDALEYFVEKNIVTVVPCGQSKVSTLKIVTSGLTFNEDESGSRHQLIPFWSTISVSREFLYLTNFFKSVGCRLFDDCFIPLNLLVFLEPQKLAIKRFYFAARTNQQFELRATNEARKYRGEILKKLANAAEIYRVTRHQFPLRLKKKNAEASNWLLTEVEAPVTSLGVNVSAPFNRNSGKIFSKKFEFSSVKMFGNSDPRITGHAFFNFLRLIFSSSYNEKIFNVRSKTNYSFFSKTPLSEVVFSSAQTLFKR